MTAGPPPISVYMITKDNIRTVEKALLSVVRWADEIVAVDSGSTDGTVETLKRYTDRVYHRDWPGFRDQYQHAQGLTKNKWVLFIDADEEVGPELAREIADLFATGEPKADGYITHRRTYYLGRLIRYGGWYPDFEVRLYRKDRGGWKGGLHAKVHVDGVVKELEHVYLHYNYKDIADQIRTVNLYSDIEAVDMDEADKKVSLFKMLFNPPFRFFRDYLLKRGFLDGMPGLIIAVTTSYYLFAKYAKLWERRTVLQSDGKES
ncbi:MAG: glycosyltransferase family 2 protein [Deltaproteobacteria bacterium]|nr:glycosyltransferase family 2 protein [Candidatus Zymogenaceae bacterium]